MNYGDVRAVNDVSFEVRAGETVSIVGANGAGKSTILAALSGVIGKSGGRVGIGGTDITAASAHDIVDLGLIHIPEGRRLFRFMSVEENLEMGAYAAHARARQKSQMEFVYDLLRRLKERRHQIVNTMSGGEQQMCAIGRGLMSCPKFLMMDEPAAGLNDAETDNLAAMIARLKSNGLSMLVVEHDIDFIMSACDKIVVMDRGQKIADDTPDRVRQDERVIAAYIGQRAANVAH